MGFVVQLRKTLFPLFSVLLTPHPRTRHPNMYLSMDDVDWRWYMS